MDCQATADWRRSLAYTPMWACNIRLIIYFARFALLVTVLRTAVCYRVPFDNNDYGSLPWRNPPWRFYVARGLAGKMKHAFTGSDSTSPTKFTSRRILISPTPLGAPQSSTTLAIRLEVTQKWHLYDPWQSSLLRYAAQKRCWCF